MATNEAAWDYSGYWNAVIGHRSATDVVHEFDLAIDGLDEWLGWAEAEAWSVGGHAEAMPPEFASFHARALAELTAAIEAQS